MQVSLNPKLQKFVEDRIRDGEYATAEEVIEAGLATLEQQELFGDFEPGELDRLLAEGEQDIKEGRVSDGASVFHRLKAKSKARRCELES